MQVPHLNPFPQPNSVVVLDNCITHHNSEFLRLISDTGAIVLYLPPYSPEYNPVGAWAALLRYHAVTFGDLLTVWLMTQAELVFNTMKMYCQRHGDPLMREPVRAIFVERF
jgi:hypothetical protein